MITFVLDIGNLNPGHSIERMGVAEKIWAVA